MSYIAMRHRLGCATWKRLLSPVTLPPCYVRQTPSRLPQSLPDGAAPDFSPTARKRLLLMENWHRQKRFRCPDRHFLPVLRDSRTRRFRPPLRAGIIDKMLLIDNEPAR